MGGYRGLERVAVVFRVGVNGVTMMKLDMVVINDPKTLQAILRILKGEFSGRYINTNYH